MGHTLVTALVTVFIKTRWRMGTTSGIFENLSFLAEKYSRKRKSP
jgi:hypothetical protein